MFCEGSTTRGHAVAEPQYAARAEHGSGCYSATRSSICHYSSSNKRALDERIAELENTCTLERALVATAATITLLGLVVAAAGGKWWLLPAAVAPVLLVQLAAYKWCPLVPVLRYFGFRRAEELVEERYALKLLRGDFAQVVESLEDQSADPDSVIEAVRN